MKEITVSSILDNLPRVLAFVRESLEGCSSEVTGRIELSVEEIFVNIASYAYNPDEGPATVRCSIGGEPLRITIQFEDHGKPYNPLEKEDPDVNVPLEERPIGGLGIFFVKNIMDSVAYKYEDGRNIFTISKLIEDGK